MAGLEVLLGVLFVVVAIVALLLIMSAVRIFKEYERGVRFNLGRFTGVVGPGLVLIMPVIEKATTVDLRTKTLEVPRQDVITKDNATVGVDAVIYYKVIDPAKVVLTVEDFAYATIRLAQTTLRSIIGDMSLDDVLSKREMINTKLRTTLDEATDKWGVKAEAVEIKEVEPPRAIQEAMTKQMAAERTKRATILEAEGNKQAKILQAEGERDANVARSEGERQAKILKARGEADAIKLVADSAKTNLSGSALTLWQLKTLEEVGKAPSTKFVVPIEFTEFMTRISEKIGGGDKKK